MDQDSHPYRYPHRPTVHFASDTSPPNPVRSTSLHRLSELLVLHIPNTSPLIARLRSSF
ncbi:hypothetical protein C7212DRAFT_318319 [Tuber magnatum]|uniref:Uncharacterized protein n=1 Tax=Tuber magnatum TaxID=42249 RepID=A0A317SRI3_9PEZI|nr:hypothetical protein C7212DRAFT_318319 [Tuber magnatum]